MCGRFVQYQGIAGYLEVLGSDSPILNGYDNQPIARHNVAPGTRVNILHGDNQGLRIDPVHWGWNSTSLAAILIQSDSSRSTLTKPERFKEAPVIFTFHPGLSIFTTSIPNECSQMPLH